MKILLLCWRDSTHPLGGGSERYLEHVGEHLAAQGHEVLYFSASHTDAPRKSARNGVRYLKSGGKYSVYPAAWWLMALGRIGIGPARGVDAVVDTQNGIPFFARLVAGAPTVLLTHHCHEEQWPVAGPAVGRLGWFLESRLAPRVYRGARYVTVSEASKSDLVGLGVQGEDIAIVANGIDPVPASVPLLPDDGRTHLLTLSRLVPNKQIEHAMLVVADFVRNNEYKDVVLDVVGSGWWEEKLRARARELGIEDRVIFYGQVTEDYKHALLARAAVHLMPSAKEGWGLAVTEAAQHGVPTVGYRSSGGLRDSIADGETGLLVDDLPGLFTATRRLLDDAGLRQRLGDAAREHAAGYSWADTGRRFEEILNAEARARR